MIEIRISDSFDYRIEDVEQETNKLNVDYQKYNDTVAECLPVEVYYEMRMNDINILLNEYKRLLQRDIEDLKLWCEGIRAIDASIASSIREVTIDGL